MQENQISFSGHSSLNAYGGGLAAVHSMGAIKFLMPRSKINFFEGVSAGSLIISILISNDFNVEKLIEIWFEIDKRGAEYIFRADHLGGRVRFRHFFGKALYDNDGIKNIIDKYVNVEKIMAWEGEFIVVVKNMTRGRKLGISTKDERIQKNPNLLKAAILASTSLGGLLPPALFEGEWYRDGLTCSLVASIEREMDNIFVILNRRLDEEAGEHHENDLWYYQFIDNIQDGVRDKVIADIKHAKRLGYKIIEQNPTDIFDDIKVDKRIQIKNFVKDAVDAINPLSQEPIEDRAIFQRKLIIFTPTNPVKTLKTDAFKRGDMKMAIERSIKEVEDFSIELAKQL